MITRKNNFATTAFLTFVMLSIQVASIAKTPSDLSKAAIIPKPVSVIATGGTFTIKSGTDIYVSGDSKELKQIGQFLADKLKQSTGYGIEVKATDKIPGTGSIYLKLNEGSTNSKFGDEGYELAITKKTDYPFGKQAGRPVYGDTDNKATVTGKN